MDRLRDWGTLCMQLVSMAMQLSPPWFRVQLRGFRETEKQQTFTKSLHTVLFETSRGQSCHASLSSSGTDSFRLSLFSVPRANICTASCLWPTP